MQKVYLAGGMRGSWQDKVKEIGGIDCFDPRLKPDNKWSEYGPWDIHHIKQSDICFAYLHKENPSGYGLAAEIGYAKGLGKTVILVIEPGHEKARYFDFLRAFADVVFDRLYDGIKYLETFAA